MRFKVKKGVKGWLVWDDQAGKVAVVDGYQAINLSAETAYRFAERLNELHGKMAHFTPEDPK
jgi:hypothetical protein